MPAHSLATYIAICIAMVLGYEQLYRQWVKPGGEQEWEWAGELIG